MNLLMVNDAIATIEAMKSEILWVNYGITNVYTAYNVEEGKSSILSNHIDILLCDIEMPGENGIALIRWIREQNYDIDCILLTCHADFLYARDAISLGCQEYILIPASYEDIGTTILKSVTKRTERLSKHKLLEYGKSWLLEKEQNITLTKEASRTPKDIVEECSLYIINNLYNEELSVTNIAAHFYLNPIYLNRIFKKVKNVAINQFIITKKMELAAELLKLPNASAVSVAKQVGYPNYSYFSSIFKKHFGCAPTQYRQ